MIGHLVANAKYLRTLEKAVKVLSRLCGRQSDLEVMKLASVSTNLERRH